MSENEAERDALAGRLTIIGARLIRASYDDDPERMAAALGNGALAVKAEVDRLRARVIPPAKPTTPAAAGDAGRVAAASDETAREVRTSEETER